MPANIEFSRHGQIETLTALRGVVALWVVLYHYRQYSFSVPLAGLWKYGYLAVDVFFILSGFVMVYVYGEAFLKKKFSYREFLVKRFARIYPVHFVTMAVMAGLYLVSGMAGLNVDPENLKGLWINIFLLQGWGLQEQLTLNYPSWSISAAAFAYLLFPVFAAAVLIPRRDLVFSLAMLFAVFWVFGFNLVNGYSLFGAQLLKLTWDFSVLRIVPEFLLGAALAVRVSRLRWNGLVLFVPAILLQAAALYIDAPLLFVALVPMLIAGLYLTTWRVPRWLVYLGTISYSLYMVHAVVEKIVFKVFGLVFHWDKGSFPVAVIFVGALIAVGAAHLLYRFVEHPCRDRVLQMFNTRGAALQAAEK